MLLDSPRVFRVIIESIRDHRRHRANGNCRSDHEETFVNHDSQPQAYAEQQGYPSGIHVAANVVGPLH